MKIVAYAVPAFLLLIVLEAVLGRRRGAKGYTLADTVASLAMGLGNRAVRQFERGSRREFPVSGLAGGTLERATGCRRGQ